MYHRQPGRIAEQLTEAGYAVHLELVRQPGGNAEKVPRAYVMARKR